MKTDCIMKPLFFFIILFFTHTFQIYKAVAQADSSIVHDDRFVDTSDTLEFTDTTAHSDFCGCEGIEQVKRCKSCFESEGPVLKTGYDLSFVKGKIIKGSCWNFVNEVYQKSGVEKTTVFMTKKSGPFADVSLLRPGDWIYHVNYGYHGIEHSAIFVCWKDRKRKIAITMSYVGQNRPRPGRLDEADMKGVYGIFRAKDNK